MKTKIIGTGLSGLVGSRVVELLQNTYDFEDISRKTATDITDPSAVLSRLQNSSAEWVIHMAAYTNVDQAEQQKDLKEESEAWKINVLGTENVVQAATQTNKKILYVSTDFVFDGQNTPKNGYTENDSPHAINWYGQTKMMGEKIIQQAKIPWLIARIAYPYRALYEKNDFMRAMKKRLEQKEKIQLVTDHIFCPTFIDDIAQAINILIRKNAAGIFHVTGSQSMSPYQAGLTIAATFHVDKELIQPTTRAEYFAQKAERPFDLSMNNDKIKSLGMSMHSFEEGLAIVKKQLQ